MSFQARRVGESFCEALDAAKRISLALKEGGRGVRGGGGARDYLYGFAHRSACH